MSYTSVASAFTTLAMANVPGLETVIDARAIQQGDIPASKCPALVLSHHAELETPFTEESEQRTWWLDVALWNYYPSLSDSIDDFDDLVESVKRTVRANDDLMGLADTSEMHVIGVGKQQRMETDVWMPSGVGQIIRGVTISFQVWESVGW